MIIRNNKTYLTTSEAAELLNVTPFAVQQARSRGKIPSEMIDGKRYYSEEDVESYYPSRRKLPRFNGLSPEAQNDIFISLQEAANVLHYSPAQVRGRLAAGTLSGYCATDGSIMVSKTSIANLMGVTYDDLTNI